MILFKPEHAPMILERRKTQTRRLGKKRWNVGAVHQARTKMFGKPFARLRILGVREDVLEAVSQEDAEREGYHCPSCYRAAFGRINDRMDPLTKVWVVDFELVEESA